MIFKSTLRTEFYLLALVTLLLSDCFAYSQEPVKKATRQSALEAFSDGEFESALNQFIQLSNQFTQDPVYKYYTGVCLVNLGRESVKATELLKSSIQSSVIIKTVPSDSWFYLGRAQQMEGKFEEAIISYDQFAELSGKKTAKSFGVDDFKRQCLEKEGKIIETSAPKEALYSADIKIANEQIAVQADEKAGPAVEKEVQQTIEIIRDESDDNLNSALDLQYKADSITKIADGLRKEMNALTWDKRVVLQKRISDLDSIAAKFQKLADNQYFGEVNNPSQPEEADNINESEKIITGGLADDAGVAKSNPLGKENIVVQKTAEIPDTGKTDNVVLSVFEVKSPGSVIAKTVPVNELNIEGLAYLIQIAVFRNPVSADFFKGLGPINGLKAEGSDRTYYYAGIFRQMENASRALTEVKKTGFADAFIVAIADNKIISAERAKVLEKDWSQKSLFPDLTENSANNTVITKDTIPSSLLFRVEVIRSQTAFKADIVENLKNLAGDKGCDFITDEKGMNLCLIGKFINFETASEYTDLIKRNGYKDARVVAYIGKIEISVETAMKLFER